ncbi:MAG: DUF222 domain-containing protein, partial [Nocardioides sp.]|nr:DUF222 domain-containing protein [Nocardioides sp.]
MSTTFQAPSCETKVAVAERVRGLRSVRDDADREILFQATVWADMHPPEDGSINYADATLAPGERISRPEIDYDAGAGLAAALGMRSESGEDLIAEALEVRHRLPRVWARVLAGEIEAWRARRIAQQTLHYPDDVVTEIDEKVADIAHRVGVITLDRLIDAAMM